MESWHRALGLIALGAVLGCALGVVFAPKFAPYMKRAGLSSSAEPRVLAPDIEPDQSVVFKRIRSPGGAAELRLHVFAPAPGMPDRARTLVLFHGGGWVIGSARQLYPHCKYLAARGYGCVSGEYRIKAKHGSEPLAALFDTRDAIAFVRANQSELGLPDGEIWAGGGSAGATLALVAATAQFPERDFTPVSADGLVLFNPVLDTSRGSRFAGRLDSLEQGYSPLADIGSFGGPVLILNGNADRLTPVQAAQEMTNRLAADGAQAELEIFEGEGHGFYETDRFWGISQRVLDFLETH